MEIDFRKAASIDDVVTVHTELKEATGARIVLGQSVLRESEVLVRATVTVALVGATGRAVRLPPTVRAAFTAIGASSNR